jgi:hypothetical protein
MDIDAVYQDILKQFKVHLDAMPESKGSSLEYVVENLRVDHVEGALWINQKYGMNLVAANFHNMMASWDEYSALIEKFPNGTVNFEGTENLQSTDFHPANLIEYLKLKLNVPEE